MKVLVYGANGTMGKVLVEQLKAKSIDYIAVDPMGNENEITTLDEAPKVDVLIDFSHYSQTDHVLAYVRKHHVPCVVATTGHSDEALSRIEEASKSVPILKSANLSFGIHVLHKILKEYTHLLEDDYDIEIVEKHHKHKIDAPSGTAYLLANSIQAGSQKAKTLITDRSQHKEARKAHQIGISAVRGGAIVGEHCVSFIGESDIIELTHVAQSKRLFTEGAIKAAYYIANQAPGLYTMDDLIEERRG